MNDNTLFRKTKLVAPFVARRKTDRRSAHRR